MDGVLADSEPVYHAAMQTALAPLGYEVTEKHQRDLMGRSPEDTWEYFREAFGIEGSLDPVRQAYDMELQQQLSRINRPLPGVRDLIGALRQRGVPVAVASSSTPSWMQALLTGLGLDGAFDAVVSGAEVEHPKPAPDIYREAAARFGVSPERCIAIEDTPPGLAAANAAGMLSVQVRSSSTAWPPQPSAAIVLESLEDFDLRLLAADGSL